MDPRRSLLRFGHVEAQVLNVLWRIESGDLGAVHAAMPTRGYSRIAVSEALRKLNRKRIVLVRQYGRQRIYIPGMSRTEFIQETLLQLSEFFLVDEILKLVDKSMMESRNMQHVVNSVENSQVLPRSFLTGLVIFLSHNISIIPEVSI